MYRTCAGMDFPWAHTPGPRKFGGIGALFNHHVNSVPYAKDRRTIYLDVMNGNRKGP